MPHRPNISSLSLLPLTMAVTLLLLSLSPKTIVFTPFLLYSFTPKNSLFHDFPCTCQKKAVPLYPLT